ncbi:hypothetical protein BDV29DRAFT_15917 [Aspergillus leporis]|uniref:Uncharacterized protein n=1 Tax=Aspergillus leporis TaxID=41062 RepID=A0A5N5WWR0_9EURO|nr:hypothetical protein BDV29DRAFT_15917 [Aspergillus leporis]
MHPSFASYGLMPCVLSGSLETSQSMITSLVSSLDPFPSATFIERFRLLRQPDCAGYHSKPAGAACFPRSGKMSDDAQCCGVTLFFLFSPPKEHCQRRARL